MFGQTIAIEYLKSLPSEIEVDPVVADLFAIPDWVESGRIVLCFEPVSIRFDGVLLNSEQMFQLRNYAYYARSAGTSGEVQSDAVVGHQGDSA